MANASLGIYDDAINDLNVAKTVEVSLGGKSQVESELQTLLHEYSRKSSPLQRTVKDLHNLGKIVFIISYLIYPCTSSGWCL